MHAQQGQPDVVQALLRMGVEDVPRARDAVTVAGADQARPPRVEPGESRRREGGRLGSVRCHHAISMTAAFRPDPMPMQAMRWPASKPAELRARVKGTDAGPMLPRVGKITGVRAGSIRREDVMAAVWTFETWWMT